MFKRPSPTASAWTVQFPLNEMEVGGFHSIPTSRDGKHNNSKRRFDDTQIRSLETIFESEAKPELRVKQQLANKLGLQPRQVAIWFQNKRARSKSKQIESEYNVLKDSYDNLASKFESLKKENESLLIQVQKLRKLTAKKGFEEYEKEDIKLVIHDKPDFPKETYSTQLDMTTFEDTNEEFDYLGQENTGFDVAHIVDASLTSTENGCSLESNDLVDNSSCNSQWWEF